MMMRQKKGGRTSLNRDCDKGEAMLTCHASSFDVGPFEVSTCTDLTTLL